MRIWKLEIKPLLIVNLKEEVILKFLILKNKTKQVILKNGKFKNYWLNATIMYSLLIWNIITNLY